MNEIRARVRETLRRAGLAQLPPGVLAAALGIAVVAIVLGLRQWWPRAEVVNMASKPSDVAAAATLAGTSPSKGAASNAGTSAATASGSGTEGDAQAQAVPAAGMYVHVVGAVRHPGLYQLSSGSRVADAVASAGGLLGSAAERGLNLARPLTDGEQIVVPTQDELASNPSLGGQAGQVGQTGVAPVTGGGGGASPASGASGQRVNVNTADVSQLDTLPGVGPSTAQKIVDEREANGPFTSVDDLGRVPGIGPKKLEALRDAVVTQ